MLLSFVLLFVLLESLIGLKIKKKPWSWPHRHVAAAPRDITPTRNQDMALNLKFIKLNGANGLDNDGGEEVDIPDLDLGALMAQSDMPKAPTSEEEIKEESFEGFLRSEFLSIHAKENPSLNDENGKPVLDFETFYQWKAKMGIVFEKEEIQELYSTMVGKSDSATVGLMSFIELNKIIDESNAAEY